MNTEGMQDTYFKCSNCMNNLSNLEKQLRSCFHFFMYKEICETNSLFSFLASKLLNAKVQITHTPAHYAGLHLDILYIV